MSTGLEKINLCGKFQKLFCDSTSGFQEKKQQELVSFFRGVVHKYF
jgi:hypothetical protein